MRLQFQSFVDRWRMKKHKIQSKGSILFRCHETAKVLVKKDFIFGTPTLAEMSKKNTESILVLEKDSELRVESFAVGRGGRIKLFCGAKVSLGKDSYISDDCFISISKSLSIGSGCAISWDVQIFDNDGHQFMDHPSQDKIVIGDRVWVGCGVTILKGTVLGDGCVVAAGAVVRGEFPAGSLIGGVPAKVIRSHVTWT